MYNIVSVAAVVSYFVPLFIVLIKRLLKDHFFSVFAAYWAFGGLMNVTDLIPGFPFDVSVMIGVFYNMLDIPFILAILYFTTTSILVRKFTSLAIAAQLIIEVVSVSRMGVNYDALKYSLGTGVLFVLIVVTWEIIRYLQKIEHSNRQNAKVFIYAALLFEYATFILIYIFDYFVTEVNREDSFLIYYISTLVAIFIASCGYLIFRKYELAGKNNSPING